MVNQSSNSLRISGAGTATGGTYDSVRIDGTGRITGDLDCLSYVTNGSSFVDGSIRAKEMTTNGSATVSGHVQVERLVTNGSLMVERHVRAQRMTTSGSANVYGDLYSDELISNGGLHVGGSCQAGSFTGNGSFHIQELLHADQIKVTLHGRSDAREISGLKIRVVKSKFSLFSLALFSRKSPALTVDTIQGEMIELEHTRAAVVRGKQVRIGKRCEIDLLEVEDAYEVSPDAHVRVVRRIGSH